MQLLWWVLLPFMTRVSVGFINKSFLIASSLLIYFLFKIASFLGESKHGRHQLENPITSKSISLHLNGLLKKNLVTGT